MSSSSPPPAAGMWMPGTPKPSSPSIINHKRPRSEPQKAQLSGATRNMRFMQRNNTAITNTQRQPEPVDLQQQQPMDATSSTTPCNSSSSSDRGVVKDDTVASASVTASDTVFSNCLQRATPFDMYGREQSMVLGRRSFGGFNKVTAENWYAQQQEDGYQQKNKQHSTAGSDDELLRRYQDLAQGRNINDGTQRRNGNSKNNNKRARSISNSGKKKR